ncbi:hypothetical protein [Sphingobacterium mizutaii]|uniref:hypothetical protein n=1 Tax=Sphingobacterium mizutaii TaxID=1010 RepID=UPI001627BBE0|nr:hypothetical protein [Sphingobacterium mizutaii]
MENNELNLSHIWKKQPAISPDLRELKQRLSKYRKNSLKKKWTSNITLGLTVIFILSIWFLYDASTIYPKIGMSFIILAISLSLIKFNLFYKSIFELNKDQDNKAYLNSLLNIQEKQRNIQSRFMNVYFSLLSIGILIYLYEFCLRMSYGMAIITYALTLGWLLFVWLYLKPRIVKKQNRELQGYIDSIHKIIESEND